MKYQTIACDWDPDLDLNGLGPLVRNPANPSSRTRRRHHQLLTMLLDAGDLDTIHKIMVAYPYLRKEYADRVALIEMKE